MKDFAAGTGGDRIGLTGLASSAGVLEFVQSGSVTLVRFDADGAADPQLAATLMSLQNVLASSITSDNVIGAAAAPVPLVGVADAPAAAFLSYVIDGGAGDERINTGGIDGVLNGGGGIDTIRVQTDADVGAFGGAGNDRIEINANDYLAQGRVVANGGEGDGTIILTGQTQNSNQLTAIGGDGSERFGVVGSAGTSIFSVRDFAVGAGGDRMDLSSLLSGAMPPGHPFATGILRYVHNASDTVVQFDADGAAAAQADYVTMMKRLGMLTTTLTPENLITVVKPVLVGVVAAERATG